jgi:hypothetical protein
MKAVRLGFFLLVAGSALSCASTRNSFQSLLGPDPSVAWRGFKKADLPVGWQLVEGALTRVGAGGDIVTREQYQDFELELEWKIAKGGNSGVFFHVSEDTMGAVYQTGPEMQVLDNAGHPDGRNPLTSAGSNFALHAPARDVTRPAGQWNRARLVVNGARVEHWLNDVLVVRYDLWTPEWKQRVRESKFSSMPRYGLAPTGHIALQDHGDWVAYRNIRIRRLK